MRDNSKSECKGLFEQLRLSGLIDLYEKHVLDTFYENYYKSLKSRGLKVDGYIIMKYAFDRIMPLKSVAEECELRRGEKVEYVKEIVSRFSAYSKNFTPKSVCVRYIENDSINELRVSFLWKKRSWKFFLLDGDDFSPYNEIKNILNGFLAQVGSEHRFYEIYPVGPLGSEVGIIYASLVSIRAAVGRNLFIVDPS